MHPQEFAPDWRPPVAIRIGRGHVELIHNPREGLDYLAHRWPLGQGPLKAGAQKSCCDALENKSDLPSAREAFIAAAIEVDVLA